MKNYNYNITLENGSRYTVAGENKRVIINTLHKLGLPVVAVERIYKTGKRAEAPF